MGRIAERALEAQPGELGFSVSGEHRSGVPWLQKPGGAPEQRPERLDGTHRSSGFSLRPDAPRIELVGLRTPNEESHLVSEPPPTVRISIGLPRTGVGRGHSVRLRESE